jgi:hypothetical protein
MKKQILLSMALLIAVSCVPMQAAETKSKSTWIIVKNCAKIIVGSWLTWKGIKGVYGTATFDPEEARQEIQKTRPERQAKAAREGLSAEQFQEQEILLEDVGMSIVRGARTVGGVISAGATVGGAALIYSGIKGLTEDEEEPVKTK